MAIKRKYELNQLYLGKHNNYVKIAYYDENSGRYVNVLIPNRTETYNKKFDEEFEVELPLEEPGIIKVCPICKTLEVRLLAFLTAATVVLNF